MKPLERAHWLKIAILAMYFAVIVGTYAFLHIQGISVRNVPGIVSDQVKAAGVFGPFMLILFYALSTIIPFPTFSIAMIGGALFGPWIGSLAVIFGVNLAGTISFFLARYLGRHFVSEHERGWVKKYDDLLTEQGMLATMAMRLLFFPYDAISIGCGLTRMSYREYALGTFLGTCASTISFVVLGEAFTTPASLVFFLGLMIVSIAAAFLLRRSAWARKHIFVKSKEPQTFE
ncbi:MAG: TVP38/TMEM64 family protein [Patescibacteria group bacterium]